nr:hypothetical protein [Vibrio sinus]
MTVGEVFPITVHIHPAEGERRMLVWMPSESTAKGMQRADNANL